MEVAIQGFWRNTKSTKDFDRKVTKIGVPAKQSPNHHQQSCVDGCHDYHRAEAIGPRTIAERAFDPEDFTNGWTHQLSPISNTHRFVRKFHTMATISRSDFCRRPYHHRRGTCDSKYSTYKKHFSVPSGSLPFWHGLGSKKLLPKRWTLGGIGWARRLRITRRRE